MPTFKRYTGSAWTDPANVRRWSGSAWVEAGFVRRWSGSAWEDVWPLLGINITNSLSTAGNTLGNTATARYRCTRSGLAQRQANTGSWVTFADQWHEAPTSTIGDGYETRLVSGTLTGWPASWTALSADRTGSFSSSALGTYETSGVIAIRKIGDTGDGVTATITLRCTITNPI